MIYRILKKYTSGIEDRIFYQTYNITNSETGESEEYKTSDLNELKETVKLLDKEIGFENIRVISDFTSDFKYDTDLIPESEYQPMISDELIKDYNDIYKEIFVDNAESEDIS